MNKNLIKLSLLASTLAFALAVITPALRAQDAAPAPSAAAPSSDSSMGAAPATGDAGNTDQPAPKKKKKRKGKKKKQNPDDGMAPAAPSGDGTTAPSSGAAPSSM